MLSRRLQVLIDEQRWARLQSEADRRKVSVGTVVREAIDERYPSTAERRAAAIQAVLDANPIPVGDIAELKKELNEIRSRTA
jgi:hypothetical protein